MNTEDKNKYLVCVRCYTFNHANYIEDAMNGFTMQETTFPFVCTIVDDASTDGEQEVIKNYLKEHFVLDDNETVRNEETDDYVLTFAQHKTNRNCYFAVLFLKYNHHSIKRPKKHYIKEWIENIKYIAHCEGDDYWINPQKLQKQVDVLEANPGFTMVCNRTKLYSERQKKYIGENYCYDKSQMVRPKDVIYRTGVYISTCSVVYRKELRDNIPDYWKKCKVGDYPLHIMCAMKGKVYYLNDIMSVYRVQIANSWTGQQKWGKLDEGRIAVIKSRINMFKGFAKDFPKYKKYFKNKVANEITRNIPFKQSQQDIDNYLELFSEDIKRFGWAQKLDLWMRRKGRGRFKIYYLKYFQEKFNQRRIFYDS